MDQGDKPVAISSSLAIRPIHDALRESVANFDICFKPTLPSFRRDRTQTAGAREQSVTGFLESYFPPNWSVKKGPIYDNHGNVSAEVDCALCVPEHPPCSTPNRDLILAEGVYAAIEVKPDIRSLTDESEFARSLKQAFSIKRLKRVIRLASPGNRKSWPDEMHRIPYIIFAERISDLKKSAEFLNSQKEKNSWNPWDLPDIVVGYKDGLIYHAPDVSLCSIAPLFKKHNFVAGEGYLSCPMAIDTLILFLSLLYSFISPQPQTCEPILKKYLFPLEIPAGMELFAVD